MLFRTEENISNVFIVRRLHFFYKNIILTCIQQLDDSPRNGKGSLKKKLHLPMEEIGMNMMKKSISPPSVDKTNPYLNTILYHISQGIVFIGMDGTITTYNPAAETMLGAKQHDTIEQKFWDKFEDDLFGFSMREALLKKRTPESTYAKVVEKELQIHPSFVTEAESFEGLILLIRDVTNMRQLQAIADRSNRMKDLGEMVAMIAHEIRNPLGGIKGFAALLEEDLKEIPAQKKLATHIVEGADTLNRLMNNILHYSRPLQLQQETTDLLPLLQNLRQHVEADQGLSHNIEISVNSACDTLIAPIDPQQIKSAILNLVVNAIQAMPNGGDVTIHLEEQSRCAKITVTDTGMGIAPDNLDQIFSPFYTTKPEGNGFGLAEVHKVIQAHGGSIDVYSLERKGTTFTILLPLHTYPCGGGQHGN